MNHKHRKINKTVYVIDGLRTPQLKSTGKPGIFSASDLAVSAARALLLKMPFSAEAIDEVIIGCVMPDSSEANIARQISLRIGCHKKTPAWTVQRNCASGLQAIDSGMNSIRSGIADLVMVGGTEVMSRAPLLWNKSMVIWLAKWFRLPSHGLAGLNQHIQHFFYLRPGFFKPVFSLLNGLTDPLVSLSMGQTAENLAWRFNISRTEMDHYALQSHERLAKAVSRGDLDNEITPIYDKKNHYYDHDNGVRNNTSIDKLARLRPFFDKKYGAITAGNSAQISDGASILLLASEKMVKAHKLSVLGKLIDCHWEGLAPEEMGLGPAYAIPPLLNKYGLTIDDIDYWEINEAFAAQVLACKKALNDDKFCRDELKLTSKAGEIPDNHLNSDGGGISLGHPVGASGSRIVLHLLNRLKQNPSNTKNSTLGIASLCIGGGQGGALLVEVKR
ncbi:MAG: acetyl-CoA C-acetyltransferase [gamma proteobacterium symbiont of Bathyaustriella thionipta]|nr:acetyl-CoA C-acetyltransferase [gamma proteobacterium symbiont of Bathyaustriella thionipta]MCU7950751.1 acetyl-CoA C-acetyltransferase [gamma proteobacterium symbiont of Bathyaustriella thionipta]MCU7952841.1 acetyl-CoA C-acetyltransferase [gamma proteobacterium symbiont of Bathyaustriella thionipta]MCU7957242.1 acetyl-CoA C-acetyltransferase [gamma proteobacterium symbiont of Bathyaustriella thionipta]MCU7967968.1 acetyl-CoA C-acetyltransferase [gamma proteobacterium symbiont of Bathyaustr